MKLEKLGFNSWFQSKMDPDKLDQFQIARVSAVHKDSYLVNNGEFEIRAEITGRLMFTAESPLDFPTVGDWCYLQYFDDESLAIIHEVFPRKSLLKRKTPGKKVEFQLIAANLDKSFIIQSLDENYNLRRLERYLVMVNESNITPIVLLSKSDLLPAHEIEEKIAEIHQLVNIEVLAFSNTTKSGMESIKKLLSPGETFCLVGSSGVGKTTLLNNLLGEDLFETQSVREKDGRGKHTTTHRQLIQLDNDVMIIDVPGMRELGNFDVDSGLEQTFQEIAELAGQCHYHDCTHSQEKGCAVLQALEEGAISQSRYQNYVKMNKESAYHQMSYLEKHQKDKKLGKMIKSVLQAKHKRNA
ncbi:MAG: ribosome small subunit-dependent GTPase A [SAR324 cluster bacterium]|nr:ribosome small subunit-dependent GTPase A [SAR324 cluster bacterium]